MSPFRKVPYKLTLQAVEPPNDQTKQKKLKNYTGEKTHNNILATQQQCCCYNTYQLDIPNKSWTEVL
jgi:hypothetical protein